MHYAGDREFESSASEASGVTKMASTTGRSYGQRKRNEKWKRDVKQKRTRN